MKKNHLFLVGIAFFLSFLLVPLNSQTINPNLFGINYWFYQSETGYDGFMDYRDELQQAELKIVRIGGNYANNTRRNASDRSWYLGQINRIKAMGAVPLVQLPIHLSPAEVVDWYNWFNVTNNAGIVYWAIGNEPDPGGASEANNWFNGTHAHDGYHYTWFRGKFRANAKALKDRDANSIIVGPSFRHFWQGGDNCPLRSYYQDFITDIGSEVANNGLPILDVFAFNRYGVRNESETRAVFNLLTQYLGTANASRPADRKLSFAITECNADRGENETVNAWYFRAGQYISLLTKLTMENGGQFVIPWSVFESGGSQVPGSYDFSLFNSNRSKRSTMWHLEMMSQNRRGNYLPSTQSSQSNNIVTFGMRDGNGYTVFVVNYTDNNTYSFRVKLQNGTVGGSEQVKINFAGGHGTEVAGSIAGRSTHMYRFSSGGVLQQRSVYSMGDNQPVVTNYASDPLTLNRYHIQNVWTSAYMRPYLASMDENAPIVQYENPELWWSTIEWTFEPADVDGYHYIRNRYSGKVLRLSEASDAEELSVVQVSLEGRRHWSTLMWQLQDAGNDQYWIQNRYSQKYIRPYRANGGTNVAIVQNALVTSYPSFRWNLDPTGLKSISESLNEPEALDDVMKVSVYPNPANSVLYVEFPVGAGFEKVQLYSMAGHLQTSLNVDIVNNEPMKINVEKLSPGLYVLKLLGEKTLVQKVIIE